MYSSIDVLHYDEWLWTERIEPPLLLLRLGNVQKAYFQLDPAESDLTYDRGQLGCPEGVNVPPDDNKGCLDKVSSKSCPIMMQLAVLLW